VVEGLDHVDSMTRRRPRARAGGRLRYTRRVRRWVAAGTAWVRRWLAAGTASAGLAAGLLLGAGCAPPRDPRPNLLLVSIDTLRADRLACYGGPPESGAGLCALFRGGTRYRWAFSTAPYTAPSVASLLSSRYPAYHGVTQSAASYLDDPVRTVAESLHAAGYATAAFVSNPLLDRRRNLGQGFDVYDQHMTRHERNRPGYAEREARATTDAALAWVQARPGEPWFLWVHFQDPHGPYEPPGSAPIEDPPEGHRLPVLDVQSGQGGIPAYQALPGLFTEEAYERRYLEEIAYLEPHLLRLVAGLDAASRPPEILLTADHGEAFGEDGYYFAHGHSLGLDQIHVPLLHRPADAGSREAETRVVDTPVSLIDVAPSLLALAGVAAPPGYQGRPLPDVAGDAASPSRALFAEHGRRAAVIRDGRFYSRDRELARDARERDLGEELPWLPPRSAELGRSDALPDYHTVTDPAAEPLEVPLAGFLERTRGRRGVRHAEVPNEVREQMRALGYVED
jgi:arylsulfatase A-like enzyme